MKKAYIRVSTEKQKEIRQLEMLVKDLGVEKIYLDKISGKNRDREQLKLLIQELEPNDKIYVHEISRLARSIVDLKSIVDEITQKGASVTFVKEAMTFSELDVNDPFKGLLFNILGCFAEFERQVIVNRVKEGVAIAKAEGKYGGRKRELCVGGKDEVRYLAIVKAVEDGMAVEEIRKTYKVGMGQIYKIKDEIKSAKLVVKRQVN